MKKDIKVSVIIPIYNSATHLAECLDSVIKQTLTKIEIICVDNGSDDETPKILQKYHKKDPRIIIITIPKSNAGAARNAGIKIAQGEYLSFVDADDFCDKDMLETAYNTISQSHSEIVVFEFRTYNNKTKTITKPHDGIADNIMKPIITPHDIPTSIFSSFKNCPWNKLFNHQFITENNITFQEIPRSNDVYFTNLALASAKSISIIHRPLITYRFNNKHSLQSNNNLSPIASWDAYRQLKIGLTSRGLYHQYEKSFINTFLENIFYALNCLDKGSPAYEYLFNAIRYGTEIEFSLSKHPASYYDKHFYQQYLDIINLPSTEELIEASAKEAKEKTAAEITASKSYRIGLAITKIPRSIKQKITKK